MPNGNKRRSFHTKVVGVTFRNDDGSERQDIIARCKPGDELALSSEPDNRYSDNAVAIYCNLRGWFGGVKTRQLGYLPEESSVAAEVFEHIEGGGGGEAQITEVTGGTRDTPTMGVNIRITLWSG